MPGATGADRKVMHREVLKQFQNDVQKDAGKQLPMLAFTVNRISKESLVLLKNRTGHKGAVLNGDKQWLYDNLKAIRETSTIETTPSKSTLKRLQNEFDNITQGNM